MMFNWRRPASGLAVIALLTPFTAAQELPPADPANSGTVDGVTVGTNRLPLADTDVTLMGIPGNGRLGMSYQATSDSSGRFSIQGVAPGFYAITASHADYAPYGIDEITARLQSAVNGVAAGPVPTAVTVSVGQHVIGVEIDLVPMTVLSGKVTDENGDPMPGVTVRPMLADMVLNGHLRITNAGVGVQTDADGKYQLSVYSGRWYLSFLPAVSKTAKSAPAETGAKGVSEEIERDYVTSYFPGVRELSLASGIDANGLAVPGLNVRLQKTPVYHVRGKVAGPITPDSRIVPSHETGTGRPSVVDEGRPIKADGTFDIAGLSPGPWTLVLCQYGKPGSFGRRTVQITDRDLGDIAIAVQAPADLSGSVRIIPDASIPASTATNLPAPPLTVPARLLTVRLTGLDALLGSAFGELQSDGAFTMKGVEAGRYRVDVTPPSGGYVKSVILDGRDCIDSGIDLTDGAGSFGGLQIVVSMTAAQIAGSVANPAGTASSSAVLTLMPDGPASALYRPELHLIGATDSTGHFSMKSIVPGTYRIYAWERLNPVSPLSPIGDITAFSDPEFPRLFDGMSALVTVGENESKQVSLTMISAAKMDAAGKGR